MSIVETIFHVVDHQTPLEQVKQLFPLEECSWPDKLPESVSIGDAVRSNCGNRVAYIKDIIYRQGVYKKLSQSGWKVETFPVMEIHIVSKISIKKEEA